MVGFFKKTIRDVPLEGETVLVRVDYNVPLNDDGTLADDLRIQASIPTIKYLLARNCKIILTSHLGRPDGHDPRFTLEPCAQRLAQLLKHDVRFVDDTIGDKVSMAIKRAPKVSITMLENVRFYAQEEANDQNFAKQLARDTGARYFVQDCFGVAHRAHASIQAITLFLPSVAGFLIEKEYTMITDAMKAPKRPLIAVLGGAKVSDKLQVIEAFVHVADTIIIGGAMANTFLAYKGYSMGASKVESDQKATLDKIYDAVLTKVGKTGVSDFLVLPTDLAVAKEISETATRKNVDMTQVAADDSALDIGDASIQRMTDLIASAQTVIWNGTLGYAELDEFAHGSARLCLELASRPDIMSIIGGGDTADFVLKWDVKKGASFTHVSTGGGASLELMAGKKLPGIESLLDA